MAYSYDPTYENQASGYFADAVKNAAPSPESLDRAAARLRSRTDTTARAASQETADQFAGRGLGASGMYGAARERGRAASQGTYASGLAQLEDDYTKRLQDSSQYYTAAGNGVANLGQQRNDFGAKSEELAQGNRTLDLKDTQVKNDNVNSFSKNLVDALLAFSQGNPDNDPNFAESMQKIRNQILASFGGSGEPVPHY
jgi:hypothetical protein